MALSTSVVINGLDVRDRFGFEVLRIEGNKELRAARRSLETPAAHGNLTSGARLENATLRLSGYLSKASRAAFLRAVFFDTRYPSHARAMHRLQFADDPDAVYLFDAAELVSFTEQTNQWRLGDDINVVVEISVQSVLPVSVGRVQFGQDSTARFGTMLSSAPAFVYAGDQGGDRQALFHDLKIRLAGPATNPVIASAEMGLRHDFDGLDGIGTLGAAVTGALHGLQAANLASEGDCEAGNVASWTATSATLTKVGHVEEDTGEIQRIPFGTQVLKAVSTSTNGGWQRSWSATSGVSYVVRFWVFRASGTGGTLTVNIGPSGSPIVTEAVGTLGQWVLVEYVIRATSTATYYVDVTVAQSGKTFFTKGLQIYSQSVDGSFDEGTWTTNPTGWSISGATGSVETTTKRGGPRAWEVLYNTAASDYIGASLSVSAGDVVHITGWVYRVDGSDGTQIRLYDAGSKTTLHARVGTALGSWVRFSVHAYAYDSGSATIRIYNLGSNSETLIFDDVTMKVLQAKGGDEPYWLEMGAHGKRLTPEVGDCLLLADYVNPGMWSVLAQGIPVYGSSDESKFGSAMLWQFASDASNNGSLVWSAAGGKYVLLQVGTGTEYAVTSAAVSGVQPFRGLAPTKRASIAAVGDFGLVDSSAARLAMVVEKINASNKVFGQDEESGSLTSYAEMASVPTKLLLSDAMLWEGFLVYQYAVEHAERLVALEALPRNRNRKLTYTGTLDAGNALLIDCDARKVEKWDHDADVSSTAKMSNALSDISGQFPEFFDAPVLFTTTNIGGVQVQYRRGGV